MKAKYFGVAVVCLLSAKLGMMSAVAADQVSNKESVEKIEKDIAKDREKVASKKAEIATAQTKLDRDSTQFGKDSNEVRGDREALLNLRNDLVDVKTALYKDTNKKKVELGQAIEIDATC